MNRRRFLQAALGGTFRGYSAVSPAYWLAVYPCRFNRMARASGEKIFLEAIAAAELPQTAAIFEGEPRGLQTEAQSDAAPELTRLQSVETGLGTAIGILEVRSYRAGAYPEITALCRAGIQPLLRTFPASGSTLSYVISFESLAARAEAWRRFETGSDWARVRSAANVCRIALFRTVT